uniref:Cuticle protein n=1 Tax=Daphnia galeata TaxID=27404 RepID=A0A8J2RL19_9CRUS|nr:unnamed protein product [Daphnia galeata]
MKFFVFAALIAVTVAESAERYVPTSSYPAYEKPSYEYVPTAAYPAYPSYDKPSYEKSSYEYVPAADYPAYPSYDKPSYEKPSYDKPSYDYAPQPYSFGYAVKDEASYNDYSHSETSDGNVVTGSYSVALPDGRTQIVTYKADKYGYTADVKYIGEAKYPEYKPSYAPAYSTPSYPSTYAEPTY